MEGSSKITDTKSSDDKTISVVIPTHRRPLLLRATLQGVRNQSALQRVAEVLVSENSDSKESESVCLDFLDLPIRYIQHKVPLRVESHFCWLIEQAQFPWIATVGDDDIWSRYHLEEAVRCLSAEESGIAYFSQAVCIYDNGRQVKHGYQDVPAFTDTCSTPKEFFIWDSHEMAINCLSKTPLNLWGMVAKRSAAAKAMHSAFGDPRFYDASCSDKLFLWRLSSLGKILVGREVGLFYRLHKEAASFRIGKDRPKQQLMTNLINSTIHSEGLLMGFDAQQDWIQRYGDLFTTGSLQSLQWPDEANAAFLMGSKSKPSHILRKALKSIILSLTPPAAIQAYKSAKSAVTRISRMAIMTKENIST